MSDSLAVTARVPSGDRTTGGGRTLARRLVLTFVAFAVVGALVIGVSAWAYVRQIDARHRVVDVVDVARLDALSLLTDYVNEETGVRGYVLTGDTTFLQPYTQARAAAANDRLSLVADIGSDPSVRAKLAAFDAATTRWQTEFALPAIAATKAGSRHYRSTAAQLTGKKLFDANRAAYDALDASLSGERATGIRALNESQAVFIVVMIVAALLLLTAGAVAWRALALWVTKPLESVGRDARQVADGALDHEVAPVGPPDIADLARDIDAMRRRVLEEVDLVDQARLELESANVDLARSNVELEQFAYVASHDLQEPLRKVVSFCQLLQRRYSGELDERADEYIGFAVDGATRMQGLVNDLLAFSRVGRTTAGFESVDLAHSVALAVRNLDDAITDAGARVDVGTLPTVRGDPALLIALFQNLIGNAIKFRGEEPPVVTIAAASAGTEWQFAIADNGIGIEERFADRIFVIFQRLHGRDVYGGTGIGLALCKKIVEFHGGRIWLDTKYHPGTRICWTLPANGAQ